MLQGNRVNLREFGVLQRIRKELCTLGLSGKLSTYGGHVTDENFVETAFSMPLTLVLRLVMTVLLVAILVWSIISIDAVSWLFFVSNWGILVNVLFAVCELSLTYKVQKDADNSNVARKLQPAAAGVGNNEDNDEDPQLSLLAKLTWLLGTISVTGSVGISIGYWSEVLSTPEAELVHLLDHGLQAAVVLADYMIGQQVFLIGHVIYPGIFFLLYIAFSVLQYELNLDHHRSGDRYLYDAFDWSDVNQAVTNVLYSLLAMLTIHVVFWLLRSCRRIYLKPSSTDVSAV